MKPDKKEITLTFAGDLMAHSVNFRMKDYSLIYEDIADILLNDDLSFVNLETPVYSKKRCESYPFFNVHPSYPDAAAKAGLDVFSLANNHSADQGEEGILATFRYFEEKASQDIYSAGIKEKSGEALSYKLITKGKWKILFVSVTEITNCLPGIEFVDYIKPDLNVRKSFFYDLAELRKKNPCDIFVLSIHSGEEEYNPEISSGRRDFYYSLLDCGVDVIWANHPHIAREWEIVADLRTGLPRKLIMYSLGNFISGQRRSFDFEDPCAYSEYTGDGYMLQVLFSESDGGLFISDMTPVMITTYIDEKRNFVIKKFDEDFIEYLKNYRPELENYFSKRMALMKDIGGKTIYRRLF